MEKPVRKPRKLGCLRVLGLVGAGIILVLAGILLWIWSSNRALPQTSLVVERLDDASKAHLLEAEHLRRSLGDSIWPGFGQVDIPAILYNEDYAFLIGYADPPDGWIKVPAGQQRGGPWQPVPEDTLNGSVYYRQMLPGGGVTPEAFTVRVGERWVFSMSTLEWTRIGLRNTIQNDLPEPLQPFFPYTLFINNLVSGSDQYISLMLHEAFHAFEGMQASDRLADAEEANGAEGLYPWENQDLQANWKKEVDLLAQALESDNPAGMVEIVQAFLKTRSDRRSGGELGENLVDYERQCEWLEGLARYTELRSWQLAASAADYQPVSQTDLLADFKDYQNYDQRWQREIYQLRRSVNESGEGRFYYTGMAQAFLLDRLLPGWKDRALQPGVWLEDLLQEAVQ